MANRARRNLLWLGGIALAYLALARGPGLVRRAFPPAFPFQDIPGLPGFRRIARGDVTAAPPLLIGLDPDAPRAPGPGLDALRADPCTALFGGAQGGGPVPVAYFSDVRCPWCRVLTPLLLDRAGGAAPAIRLAWHPLPLLGETSVIAARAAIAAEAQGAGAAVHARLSGTRLVPTPAALRRLAGETGIDPDRLLADMTAPRVDDRLAVSRGLADLFGFPGTPALVIGRTAVLGRIAAADLDRLIALEASEAATAPCA
ncbi:DsbA family protein [Rhodovulum marinum]|uniref:DSBA-like thioredoxin domain-containing protein n=1 Tax=Rhodovulum marinum TaxID=320662 RepID=A0A4R2PS29_9RHOB|nr:DsbA family protein [Rhodovulum marinum]TCP38660.1 DSBA-like thioredoxin domain-containing protein [Rhodovulum marinum]